MTPFVNEQVSWQDRRHTTDQTAHSTTNTPSASRSSSVTSNASHRSEPSWYSAYNGQDTTRKNSSATTSSKESKKSGFLGIFTVEDPKMKAEMKKKKEAEKKRRNEEKRKKIDKLVITSKHTAAVRRKLAMQQKQTEGERIVGTPNSAHMTAAQLEMRYPHSGPPALHGGHKADDGKHDLPALTRIVSGDERDSEEDYQERRREEWLTKKMPDIRMRQMSEGESPEDEIIEVLEHSELEVEGARAVGIELEGDQYTPKVYQEKKRPGGAWRKDEQGVWRR